MKAVRLSCLVAVVVLLTACGQKGPLTLPNDTPPANQPVPAEPPSTNPQQE